MLASLCQATVCHSEILTKVATVPDQHINELLTKHFYPSEVASKEIYLCIACICCSIWGSNEDPFFKKNNHMGRWSQIQFLFSRKDFSHFNFNTVFKHLKSNACVPSSLYSMIISDFLIYWTQFFQMKLKFNWMIFLISLL